MSRYVRQYGTVALLIAGFMLFATLLSPGDSFSTTLAASCPMASPVSVSATPSSTPGPVGSQLTHATPVGTPVMDSCLSLNLTLDGTKAGPRTLTVEITDHRGNPLNDARVLLYTRHVEMDHGTSTNEASAAGEGRFVAEDVSMGMAGVWEVAVEVVQLGEEPTTFTFVVELDG